MTWPSVLEVAVSFLTNVGGELVSWTFADWLRQTDTQCLIHSLHYCCCIFWENIKRPPRALIAVLLLLFSSFSLKMVFSTSFCFVFFWDLVRAHLVLAEQGLFLLQLTEINYFSSSWPMQFSSNDSNRKFISHSKWSWLANRARPPWCIQWSLTNCVYHRLVRVGTQWEIDVN